MKCDYLSFIDMDTRGPRCDVTPLFADAKAFAALVGEIVDHFAATGYDYVAGIDALGFVLGAAVAVRAQKGFVSVRKAGKLPVAVDSIDFVDYTGRQKVLELRQGIIPPGARVLLVDEWIETGAQMQAAVKLIEGQGGIIVGIATLNIDPNERTSVLQAKYPCLVVLGDLAI